MQNALVIMLPHSPTDDSQTNAQQVYDLRFIYRANISTSSVKIGEMEFWMQWDFSTLVNKFRTVSSTPCNWSESYSTLIDLIYRVTYVFIVIYNNVYL